MFPYSADHEQDWQPYPVDPYSAESADHTSIYTTMYIPRMDASTRTPCLQYLCCTSIISQINLLYNMPINRGRVAAVPVQVRLRILT